LIAFTIEWIRDKQRLSEAKHIMKTWNQDENSEPDFLTLYVEKREELLFMER